MINYKKWNYLKGHVAELYAMLVLLIKGYRILRKRFKNPLGEIDLIARKGKYIIFCEIKLRKQYTTGMHSLSNKQRSRIINGARLFITQHSKYKNMYCRFDYMVVSGLRIHHIKKCLALNKQLLLLPPVIYNVSREYFCAQSTTTNIAFTTKILLIRLQANIILYTNTSVNKVKILIYFRNNLLFCTNTFISLLLLAKYMLKKRYLAMLINNL